MFTLIAAVARYALLCPCIYSVLFSNAFYIMDKIHLYIYVPGGFVFVVVLKFWWKRKNAFKEMFVSSLCAHSVWKSQTGFDENKMKMKMFKEIRLSIYATNRVGKCSRSLELCKAHTTQLNSTQFTMNRIQLNSDSDSASWWCVRVVCVYQLHIGLWLWGNARVR